MTMPLLVSVQHRAALTDPENNRSHPTRNFPRRSEQPTIAIDPLHCKYLPFPDLVLDSVFLASSVGDLFPQFWAPSQLLGVQLNSFSQHFSESTL
jgi:hypothetical protein